MADRACGQSPAAIAVRAAGDAGGTDAEASKSGVGEREHAPQFSAPGESRKDAKARADGAGFRNWRRKLAADIDICLNEAKLATARE